MSKYTVELRFLIENNFDLDLKQYPIFDENYRDILNNKIIKHFYFREIGFETAELFKFYLNRTMTEIMPLYNQYYKSCLLEFNPLYNVDKTETFKKDVDDNIVFDGWSTDSADTNQQTTDNKTSNTNSNSTSVTTGNIKTDTDNLDVGSDTPQGMLAIGDIKSHTYASKAQLTDGTQTVNYNNYTVNNKSTSDTTDNDKLISTTDYNDIKATGTNQNQNTVENYTRHVLGKSEGETYSEMLIKFRDTFINVDMMVINELNSLFMLIY
jgi:hypothetical protein